MKLKWFKNNLVCGDYMASVISRKRGKVYWEVMCMGQIIDHASNPDNGYASGIKEAKAICEDVITRHIRAREGSFSGV